MKTDIAAIIFIISIVWTLIGCIILHAYEENSCTYSSRYSAGLCYLNPVWVWKNYKVNIIGCFILTILFNLACPLVSIIYWIVKLIRWVCTAGRK